MSSPPIPPPQGDVTFLFTDLVGSSQLAKKLPYRDYEGKLLDPQFALFSDLIVHHKGYECGTPAGDSIMAAFQSVHDALDCAVAMQQQLPAITYTDPPGTRWTLAARIGVHRAVEEVHATTRGLYSSHPEANYAARIMVLAHAGQIVVSDSARSAAGNRQEPFKTYANRRLKDNEEQPQKIHELLYDGIERAEPGAQFLPGWFREQNHYVPRPELENSVGGHFVRQTGNKTPYRLVTLLGMGGMGKTRAAMQCCLNAAGLFEGRLFLARLDGIGEEALSAEETRRDYLAGEIATAFGLSELRPTPETLPDLLPDTGPLLLLLDNYETVKGGASAELLTRLLEARPALRLLVTSRTKVGLFNGEIPVDVAGLLPDEARDLVRTRVRERKGDFDWTPSPAEETAIATILTETARIPLALELVTAHVGDLTLAEIATSLAAKLLGEMTQTPEGSYGSDPSWRHETLEKCYNWSWLLLSADAKSALARLSLFADRCPFAEVAACFEDIALASLTRLQQASLASREEEEGQSLYALLRPTRVYARERLQEQDSDHAQQQHFVAHYLRLVKAYGGAGNREDREKRAHLEAGWRHAMSAAEVAALLQDVASCGDIADYLIHFVQRQALWSDALPLYVQSLAIREKVLGAEHPDTAGSLNNLAMLYKSQGRYADAEPLYQRALAIYEKVLGAEHPDTALSLNNLAGLYNSQGHYAEAEPLYQRALTIREKVLGAEHPDTAQSLNNLAFLYKSQSRYGEAEPLYQRALAIREKALGAEHPDTAQSLNNLAGLYDSQGRYAEAEPLYQRALAIYEKVLGAEHPTTATSLNNLAFLYKSQSRYGEAEPLYQRALAIREKALGAEHPDTAQSLNNLAFLYKSQSRYGEAEPLYQRALAIREKALGAEHPDTALSLNNLAGLYNSQGHYAEAEPLYQRALAIYEKVLGAEHPNTKIIRGNYVQLKRAVTDPPAKAWGL